MKIHKKNYLQKAIYFLIDTNKGFYACNFYLLKKVVKINFIRKLLIIQKKTHIKLVKKQL